MHHCRACRTAEVHQDAAYGYAPPPDGALRHSLVFHRAYIENHTGVISCGTGDRLTRLTPAASP